jgi:fucose permease
VIFALSLSEALTLQWGALVMCGVAALPVARLVHAVGAGQAMAGGLTLSTLASLGAWLALRPGLLGKAWGFHAFLAALMLVAVANTALQVACNTVLAQQGDPARRTARMTLAQGFNALGVFGGVQLAALLVLGRDNPAGLTDGTRLAYLGCALLSAVILAVALRRAPRGAAPSENEPDVAPVRQALRSRWAWQALPRSRFMSVRKGPWAACWWCSCMIGQCWACHWAKLGNGSPSPIGAAPWPGDLAADGCWSADRMRAS